MKRSEADDGNTHAAGRTALCYDLVHTPLNRFLCFATSSQKKIRSSVFTIQLRREHDCAAHNYSVTGTMATIREEPQAPYLMENDGGASTSRSAYQSISFHPTFYNTSFEELRLEHNHNGGSKPTPNPTGSSKLMATSKLSALASNYPLRPVRALPDATHRYASAVHAHGGHR
jgi:hypothetical protein